MPRIPDDPPARPARNTPGRSLACLLAVFLPFHAGADGAVWVAANGASAPVYLAGTIHKLSPRQYPLPEEYQAAYDRAAVAVFETDIAALLTPEVQSRVARRSRLPDGETLRDVLDPETYESLEDYCVETGFPVEYLSPLRPSAAMLTLLSVALQQLGITAPGVDEHFYQRARDDAKEVRVLESVDQQIDFMLGLDRGDPDLFVQRSIGDLREARNGGVARDLQVWREGDAGALVEHFVKEQMLYSPELYQYLLVDRNHAWMLRLREYLDSPETELVLVGVAHLVGEDGLLAMLEREGYDVRRFTVQ